MALISEFTNQNACELNVYSGSFSPPSACRTVTHVGPRAKDQESRSRTQGPCREPRTCSACMGIEPCRGQEPRTKEQESQGPRTNDHAGAKDHAGVEMIYRKNELCMHDTDQTITIKGPRPPHIPHGMCVSVCLSVYVNLCALACNSFWRTPKAHLHGNI